MPAKGGGGVKPSEGQQSGTFVPLFNTATSQEQDCTPSKAHDSKEEWEGETMEIGV